MGRGLLVDFEAWAEGPEPIRVPAPIVLVLSIIWSSSSESRVRSMALLSTLSFAAFSASLWASAPDAQVALSRLLLSAAYENPPETNGRNKEKRKKIIRESDRNFPGRAEK